MIKLLLLLYIFHIIGLPSSLDIKIKVDKKRGSNLLILKSRLKKVFHIFCFRDISAHTALKLEEEEKKFPTLPWYYVRDKIFQVLMLHNLKNAIAKSVFFWITL